MPDSNPFESDSSKKDARTIRSEAKFHGHLVDVTRQAREMGVRSRVAVSQRLWKSLVTSYPSSRPSDYLPLDKLLYWVRDRVRPDASPYEDVRLLRPACLPYWVSEHFTIRVQTVLEEQEKVATILMAHDEVFHHLPAGSSTSLPATLLVRLARVVNDLMCLPRACDIPSLNHVSSAVSRLVEMSPLKCEVYDYLERNASSFPPEFTQMELRAVSLKTLDELMLLAEAVAKDHDTRRLVDSIRWRLRVLTSRLTDLVFLTERMLRLAASLQWVERRDLRDPFHVVLTAHVAIQKALSAGQTMVASSVVTSIRRQLSVLKHYLDARHGAELDAFRKQFDWMWGIRSECSLVELARPMDTSVSH